MTGENEQVKSEPTANNTAPANDNNQNAPTKFCKFCGAKIPVDAVLCTSCGRQVEELKQTQQTPNIVINNSNSSVNTNSNTNTNTNTNAVGTGAVIRVGKAKNKWVALILCLFLGYFGAHKFYEGKIGMGILYLLTGGLLFIGVIIDFIAILSKPNPYYV